MAILQHTAQEIAVLADSTIQRPKDLDGKTYAGFGYPNEVPTLQAVIRNDGGTGTFETVTLDTAAYEALYNKRADFVIHDCADHRELARHGAPVPAGAPVPTRAMPVRRRPGQVLGVRRAWR